MSGTATSTSPISMRGAAAATNTPKKQQRGGGLFKGWKKNTTNKSSSADQTNNVGKNGDPSFQKYLNQMAYEDQINHHQQHQSPHRRYTNNVEAPQFSPSLHNKKLTPHQITQNYPTTDEYYYHYCNDELSRQLQLAAQKDEQLNEERRMVKLNFLQQHCAPYSKNSGGSGQSSQRLEPPPMTQLEEMQHKWNLQQQQKQQRSQTQRQSSSSGSKLSRLKEELQTQTTKDTASSSSVSHTSSLTNTTPGGGGKAVTNALSTASQVFHQEQSGSNYTTTAARDGGEEENEYVTDWTPLSNSFLEQPTTSSDFDWHIDNEEGASTTLPTSQTMTSNSSSSSAWREAVDTNSGKLYYYNILTKEVSWTIPNEGRNRSKTPPPPPPPPSSDTAMQMAKTPHRDNTSSGSGGGSLQQQTQEWRQIDHRKKQQRQKQQQQQRRVHNNKSPPRTRASPSLDSIAEDDDDYSSNDDEEAAVGNNGSDDETSEDAVDTNNNIRLPPSHKQKSKPQRRRRTRSKSPFRAITQSQSPTPLLRHASSSFHLDPNRGDDPDGVGSVDDPATSSNDNGDSSSGRKSISPFRVFQKKTKGKKKSKSNPVVNMPPSLQQRGKGSGEVVGDVVSLVSYYDDPSIGALSSLDDTTLASRSFPKQRGAVANGTPLVDGVASGGGNNSERRDTGSSSERRDGTSRTTTPPRHKKHADPPGNSIDEIFHQKQNVYSQYSSGRESRSPYRRQQQRRLPDPSPMRQQHQQQHVHHSPYQVHHQSPYSRQSPQQQQQRSPYKHQQQQQKQQQNDPSYMDNIKEHRSPYSGQHPSYMEEIQQERSPYSEHEQQQHLQQPQIFVDEDGNQWMVTPQEAPRQGALQPRSQQLKNNHRQQPKQHQPRPRQIYYDEEGQPYYYEDEDYYDPEQHMQHQEHSMPPPELQTPRQGWQWSDKKGSTDPVQYQDQANYPAEEEYFVDGKGNFISFITPDPEEGDNNVLDDFDSIGMLTGDEEGPPLDEHNGGAADDDDTTAANTLNTVDLVAEVKRVWRHVQRYEQKKSMKAADSRIETKGSEEEMLVHQFSQAFVQASPGRPKSATATMSRSNNAGAGMAKSNSAGVAPMAPYTQRSTKDATQISPEKEVISNTNRGRSRSKDSRLGEHIRSTSVHSRALSSRGDSPATGSDYAMMSHGDTEMDGAFISEGMDAFFLSPGKQQTSTLKQQAQKKQHLLHPSQVAAAQKLMQNNKAAISDASKAPAQAQEHDLTNPYDFNKVKSTGTNFSQKTQTISNTTNSNTAMKAHEVEKTREQKEITNRSRSPPRPPSSWDRVQIQQREEERKRAVSPGRMYRMALKSAKDRNRRE